MKIIKKAPKIGSSTSSIAKQIQKSASKPLRVRKEINPDDLIPTPSTIFNLECSGHYQGAFQKGKIVNIIGDSHAGKTLFALSIFAECSLLKRFDNYRFIEDDVEAADEFDKAYLFGNACNNRIENDNCSNTFEDFSDNIERALNKGIPFIYLLDSSDALDTESAMKLYQENMNAREKGTKEKGSYGDGKAALFSAFFKRIKQRLFDSQSLLIIISQTRDNLGFGATFNPKVRSGGKALKFYSAHEIWLAMEKKEKKGDRTYITNVQAKISKNKLTGRHGKAYFPILFDYGVDDVTSCIDFLIREKHWSGKKTGISTNGFHPEETISYLKLVKYIESNDLEDELKVICKECYDNVISALVPSHRKVRYNN